MGDPFFEWAATKDSEAAAVVALGLAGCVVLALAITGVEFVIRWLWGRRKGGSE